MKRSIKYTFKILNFGTLFVEGSQQAGAFYIPLPVDGLLASPLRMEYDSEEQAEKAILDYGTRGVRYTVFKTLKCTRTVSHPR